MTDLSAMIAGSAVRAPESLLLDGATDRASFAGVAAEAAAWAAALREAGVKPGETVALLAESPSAWAAAWAGILFAGGVAVPLDPDDPPDALRAKLEDCGARAAAAEGEKSERLRAFPAVRLVGRPAARSGNPTADGGDPDRPAAVLYTSGSTGRPLGVTLSHANLLSNARAVAGYLGLGASDRTLSPLPFHHAYGLSVLLSHWAAGAALVPAAGFLYPQAAADELRALRCTGFSGVSFHFAALAERTDFLRRPPACLRYLAQAGDRMPPALALRLSRELPDARLYLMYGQTEAGPRISFLDPSKVSAKPESVGAPLEGIRWRIVREDGTPADAGETGELVVKGSGVMLGYWRRPEATADALRGGWLHTGDVGHLDAEGDLFLTGRKKRFLKVGGRTVHPEEIERVILSVPGVRGAAVLGLPDPALGERPHALVGWPDGRSETVLSACRAALPPYKVPASVRIVADIPASGSGKTDWERVRALMGGGKPAKEES